jgi:hypothetical protein
MADPTPTRKAFQASIVREVPNTHVSHQLHQRKSSTIETHCEVRLLARSLIIERLAVSASVTTLLTQTG